MGVTDPKHVVLLSLQPREGQPFDSVHDFDLLFFGGRVIGGKADHACTIAPLVAARVYQGFGAAWIAAQNLGQWIARDCLGLAVFIADQVAVAVIGQHLTGHEIANWSRAAPDAVGEELDQHCRASSKRRASWRSITSN